MRFLTRPADLRLTALPQELALKGDRGGALTCTFRHSEDYVLRAVDWYLAKRKRPSFWSKVLRAIAVCSAVLGGTVPLAHSASARLPSPNWGFVLLAVGAGCVLVDRVFGHSTSWMRFTRTALALQHALARAQTEWTTTGLALGSKEPGAAEQDALLSTVRRLQTDVQRIMDEEASAWVGYLTEGIDELASTMSRGRSLPPQRDGSHRPHDARRRTFDPAGGGSGQTGDSTHA